MTKRKLKGKTHFYLLKRKMYFDFHFISLFFISEQFRLNNKRRIIFFFKKKKENSSCILHAGIFYLLAQWICHIVSQNCFLRHGMNAKSKFYLATAWHCMSALWLIYCHFCVLQSTVLFRKDLLNKTNASWGFIPFTKISYMFMLR